MDAVDILKVCLRRWYVMLPILLAAAGVGYQLLQAQQVTYSAAASYGLVQPGLGKSGDQNQASPLGPGGDALVGEALEAQLNSRETQARLGSELTRGWGPGEAVNHRSYYVHIPLYETTYEVRTWGESEDEVRAVVDRVLEAAPDIADEAQDRVGVPASQRYQPFVLAPTQVEALPATSSAKLLVAVMGVGLLMGAAWSVVVDRLMRGRRERKREAAGRATEDPGTRPQVARDEASRPADERTADGKPAGPANGKAGGAANGKPAGPANGKNTARNGSTNAESRGLPAREFAGGGGRNRGRSRGRQRTGSSAAVGPEPRPRR